MEDQPSYLIILIPLILVIILLLPQKNKKFPPSPWALPIIGHFHLLRRQPLHLSLQKLLSRHGPILSITLGARRLLVVSSPTAVEECFTRNDIVFANRPRCMAADHLTYDYTAFVVAPYGDLWRQLRRVSVIEAFSSNSLQRFSGVREGEARNILRRLFKSTAEKTEKVDLKFQSSLLTVNISFTLLTGQRLIAGGETEAAAVARVKEFKELYPTGLTALDLWDFFPILRWIGFSRRKEKKLRDLQKRRDDHMNDLIRNARAARETGDDECSRKEGSLPLIHKFLALQDKDPDFYTDVVIKTMILALFIAGTDTSAITLEWSMSLLFRHPKELNKARQEIEREVGKNRLVQDLDLANLPYLRCVVDETLRLHPPAPLLLPHSASQDCTVGGYDVAQGTILMVNAWALHKDPAVWDDPEEFIPDRFRSEVEQEGVRYLPFGTGRRICPAAAMALRLVMLALALMVQCFDWEPIRTESEIEDLDGVQGVTVSKLKPFKALCKPRQDYVNLLSQL